jgi:phage shock protein A
LQRRRAQNRVAQRAHRERQKSYVAKLEKRFFELQTNYTQLDEKFRLVQQQYEAMLSTRQAQHAVVDSPLLKTSSSSSPVLDTIELKSLNEFSLCEQALDRVLAFKEDK